MAIQRQVAYKIWISDLLKSDFVKALGEWEPNYVALGDKKIARVNVVGTIVDMFANVDASYMTLVIDDGSGNIRVRGWQDEVKLLNGVAIGDIVLVVGRIKDYTGSIYIGPEIVKKLDSDWLKLRQKELERLYGFVEQDEKKITINIRGKILDLIKEVDNGEGVELTMLVNKIGNCDDVVKELIEEGEVFYIKPGFLKLMV